MKIYFKPRTSAIFTIIVLFGTSFIPLSDTQSVYQYQEQSQKTTTRQILYSPAPSTSTYLIDSTGRLINEWSSNYFPGESVYWLGNGTILRTIKTDVSGFGGEGGGVEKVTWDGKVTWRFFYYDSEFCLHHDIKPLSNGNVLMIAWEAKTYDEAIAAGIDPHYLFSVGKVFPDHIIEVQPTGSLGGTIVWEWHVWDHLIQDYDSTKENYGVVGDHPELVDVNYRIVNQRDWMHTNSIDYNEELDQILISVCYFEEIWVIDHSTTTADAAGHTGGNCGKGGDLLYRWGNPEAYRAGTASNKKLFRQHDATWIDKGCPGEGNILVFNNGLNRPDDLYSSVDEIIPPINDNGVYELEPGSSYGPESPIWTYTGSPPTSFFSYGLSGAERLKDGNTLICKGIGGEFFEVTSAGTVVWSYTNPYPTLLTNNVFKIVNVPFESLNTPSNPIPANNTTDVSMRIDLGWTGEDPYSYMDVTYDVYFGTNSTPSKVSMGQSDAIYDPGVLSANMKYYWRIVTWDSYGASADGPLWDFTTGSSTNYPPNTPTITGAANGTIQTSYVYFIEATDPEQDIIKYYIDWGDDTITITDFYETGTAAFESHIWSTKGTYKVMAKAIDEYGAESDWATLTIKMPYAYNPILQFLELLLHRFPHSFPLLRYLYGF